MSTPSKAKLSSNKPPSGASVVKIAVPYSKNSSISVGKDDENKELQPEPSVLDPLIEVNENVVSEVFEPLLEVGEFIENSPRIFSKKDVPDPLTIESLNNVIYELGIVNLCWPEIKDPVFETRTCFPVSYYTNNNKERLLLAYAENFRRQYHFHYKHDPCYRKNLFLQAPNDCGLQKMVCTTIRSTKLCYCGTNTWQGLAELVADYFVYEPLKKPMLHIPTSEEDWLEIAQEFQEKWDFPHVIGAMDGKHVMKQAPGNSGTEYYNYKHFFSIVLFALVDADYCFRYVDIGAQGRLLNGGGSLNTLHYTKD